MSVVRTGHAEIDQQHQILESLIGQLEGFCQRKLLGETEVSCNQCEKKVQQKCARTIQSLAGEARAFLIGHSTYEERMMDLLPDNDACQTHIRAHKAAHAGIDRHLLKVLGQGQDNNPLLTSEQIWKLMFDWVGDHAISFDQHLVQLGQFNKPEINFDSELVSMLDQYVFTNRPTLGPANPATDLEFQKARLEARGRFELLSAAQRKVFWLVLAGHSNKDIAATLAISVNTVKTHRAAIFLKLEVSSVVELVKKMDVLR